MKKLITVLFILSIFALNIFAQTWTTYTPQNTSSMLPDNNVDHLATDQNGNIWIGTYFSGLVKFDGTNWTNYNPNNSPMKDNTVTGLFVYNNTVWTSSYGHGLYKFDGSNWNNYAAATSGILNDQTYCVTADNSGNVWVGINSGNASNSGVVKFNGLAAWTPYTFLYANNYQTVESIAVDKQGNIWCGTRAGVIKFNGTDWSQYTKENTSGGLCGNWVREINVDASGNVWFGCLDKDPVTGYWIEGGLSKFTGSTWSNYKPSGGGLTNGYVSAIAFKGSDVWVGTGFCGQYGGNGLYKFNGSSWTNYVNDNSSFPTTCVNDLVVDKNGNLWIGSSWGLTKVDFNPTAVEETESIPTSFSLNQNYPNPFNPETVISYQLPVSGKVRLSVSDLLGREVAVLVDEVQSAGIHHSTFSTARTALSSGVYFYKLQTENFVDVKKMMIIK
ncbi:MAG: two-component regulator propeller domain-containing protein [Melioribacteraceae bacterium]